MTPPIHLRPLRPDDADEMVVVLSDPALYIFTGGEPPAREGLSRQYAVHARGHSDDRSETWLNHLVVLDDTGEAVGYVQATVPVSGGPAEIAWVIGVPWQGRGHATAAARLLLDELARRGVPEVVADIHPDHAASAAVARRLGLRPTGHLVDGEQRWEGPVAVADGAVPAMRRGTPCPPTC